MSRLLEKSIIEPGVQRERAQYLERMQSIVDALYYLRNETQELEQEIYTLVDAAFNVSLIAMNHMLIHSRLTGQGEIEVRIDLS
jgi:hypothetical protein